jgi:hypothetical protein
MNEAAIRRKLAEIADLLKASQFLGDELTHGQQGLYTSHACPPGRRTEEALDNLRMQVRYLAFDLEATRRENRYLRRMIEARRSRKRDEDQNNDQASP